MLDSKMFCLSNCIIQFFLVPRQIFSFDVVFTSIFKPTTQPVQWSILLRPTVGWLETVAWLDKQSLEAWRCWVLRLASIVQAFGEPKQHRPAIASKLPFCQSKSINMLWFLTHLFIINIVDCQHLPHIASLLIAGELPVSSITLHALPLALQVGSWCSRVCCGSSRICCRATPVKTQIYFYVNKTHNREREKVKLGLTKLCTYVRS